MKHEQIIDASPRELSPKEVALVAGGNYVAPYESDLQYQDASGCILGTLGQIWQSFEEMMADSDRDGVSDYYDRFPGFYDNTAVTMIDGANLVHMGYVDGESVWGLFDNQNDLQAMYVMTHREYTNSSDSVSIGVSATGGTFSYNANDGFTYRFARFE